MKVFRKFLCTTLITGACAWAQGTAQMHGTIRDASGAAVPGADVRATQTETGIARTTTSGADGSFVLPALATGPYQIEASKLGFSKAVETGVVLQVSSDPLVDIALKIGAVNDQVTVEANAAQVDTRSATVGTVIDNQRILELPLNGRNATDLISLSGAAVQLAVSARGKGTSLYPTPMFQVAGGLGYATAYSLDGANFTNPSSGGALTMPFPDALQEFKVDTSGASATQGRSSAVSAVTKSGTNQLHGDAFEFLRNDLVSGRSYFAVSPNTQKRNQFGGTLGGAIKKDKLFFFGGFQETTVRQDPANLEAWVPTTAMLQGDWTAITSPACNAGRQLPPMKTPPGWAGAGFSGNKINPAEYSKTGVSLAQLTLAQIPQQPDACGHIVYGQLTKLNEYQGVGRVDYQLTEKHTLFARYQDVTTEQPVPYTLPPVNVLNATVAGQDIVLQNLALGSTYVFSPTVVNAFRMGGNWFKIRQTSSDTFSICDAQLAANIPVTYYCGNAPHRTNIAISGGTGGFTIGGGQAPSSDTNNVLLSIGDDVSMVRGAHQMSFGFTTDVSRNTSNYVPTLGSGKLTISSNITGEGLADLLTGQLSAMVQTNVSHLDITSVNPGVYFADTWKAMPRFTVTASVRWDPFLPQSLKHSGIANFDMARFLAGTTTQQYKFGPPGWYYPGDPGTPGWSGAYNKPWHFSPRLGLAWDVKGDGRTSVRASFTYAYVPVTNFFRQDPEDQNPWTNGTSLQSPVGGLNNPWQGYTYINPVSGALTTGIPFPTINGNGFTSQGQYTSTPYDLNVPQTSSWNLSIQRQIGTSWLLSAAYLGSATTHIWIQEQGNPAKIISPLPPNGAATCGALPVTQCSGQDNTALRRVLYLAQPNALIQPGVVALLTSSGTMNYNGTLLSAQKRLSRGTSLQANYTWSHCISDMVDLIADGPDAGESNVIPGNRKFDRGECNGDRRQIFNLTALGQTPRFSNRALRLAASGWALSGIYSWSSGTPLNILAGSDRALDGQLGFFNGAAYQRADQVSDQAYAPGGGGPLSLWLNPAAFKVPALGTIGNARRNNVVGPATWSFNASISRVFRITENQHIELRGEAFNVTNSFRPGTPIIAVTSSQFGQIRTALDPRITQFALKYIF